MRLRALLWVAVALASVGTARAEVSGSIAVLSDDRYRGASLTDGRPAVQASIAYDHPAGPYVGALVSNVHISNDIIGPRALLYAGYVHSLTGDLVWDVGVATHRLPVPDTPPRYDYTEWYAGIANASTSVRAFRSFDYYGVGAHSWYVEANRSRRVGGRYVLSAHVGYRVINDPSAGPYHGVDGSRFDFKAAVGVDVRDFLLELSLVGTNRTPEQCPLENGHSARRSCCRSRVRSDTPPLGGSGHVTPG